MRLDLETRKKNYGGNGGAMQSTVIDTPKNGMDMPIPELAKMLTKFTREGLW